MSYHSIPRKGQNQFATFYFTASRMLNHVVWSTKLYSFLGPNTHVGQTLGLFNPCYVVLLKARSIIELFQLIYFFSCRITKFAPELERGLAQKLPFSFQTQIGHCLVVACCRASILVIGWLYSKRTANLVLLKTSWRTIHRSLCVIFDFNTFLIGARSCRCGAAPNRTRVKIYDRGHIAN